MWKQSSLYQLGSLVQKFPRILTITREDTVMKVTYTIDLHRNVSKPKKFLRYVSYLPSSSLLNPK